MSRESKAVLINHGSHTLRAGYGIHNDLFRRPTYELTARVGLPRAWLAEHPMSGSEKPIAEDYVVGVELDRRIEAGEEFEVYWPMRKGVIRDWQACIALWRHLLFRVMPLRPSLNDSPIMLTLPAPISRAAHSIITRIFFELFNAPSLSVVEVPLLTSYAAGVLTALVVDIGWESCSATPVLDCAVQHASIGLAHVGLRHCALYLAHLLRRDSSLTDALIKLDARQAASSSRAAAQSTEEAEEALQQSFVALALQLIHEGHAIFDESLAVNEQQNDDEEFDIAAALVAGRERAAIEEQERRNAAAMAGLDPDAAPVQPTGGNAANAQAQPGATDDEDAVLTTFRGMRLKVAPGPLAQIVEPLFDPSVLTNVRGVSQEGGELGSRCFGAGSLPDEAIDLAALEAALNFPTAPASRSLPEVIANSISSVVDDERRSSLWESLIITGAPTRGLKGLAGALTAACAKYIAATSAGGAQALGGMDGTPGLGATDRSITQPTNVRSLKVPDYFAEFKDRTDLAPFLGATIYGKLTFADPHGRNYLTKAAYNERGPSASFTVLLSS